MRDDGLDEAIRVAGGVGALARKIGISQPSVSNWARIPAERVLSVEAATGVSRTILRPDLYGNGPASAKASMTSTPGAPRNTRCYLRCSPARPIARCSSVSPRCAAMQVRSGWRMPRLRRRRAAPRASASSGNISISSSASDAENCCRTDPYYLTGFLHERPLARLRKDLDKLGIERAAGQAEPEDHAAILCEIMAGLVSGRFQAPPGADRELFEAHLAPWIGRFFADLEQAESADFYRGVGALGRLFVNIETEAFALPA